MGRGRIHARGEHDIHQRNHSARGQIEAAGENDDGLADGGYRKRRRATCHEADVEIAETAGADRIDDRKQQQEYGNGSEQAAMACEHNGGPWPRARGVFGAKGGRDAHAAILVASPPSAACMISFSVKAAAPISLTILPP